MRIREQQMKVYEEMVMFETRILCRVLPRSINKLDKLVPPDNLSYQYKTGSQEEALNQHHKQIRDLKRNLLHDKLSEYESVIEEHEISYQRELIEFPYELSQQNSQNVSLMAHLENYLDHHTNRIMRDILYKETLFRMKLKHPRHRPKSTAKRNTVSVYPEAIIETTNNLFTDNELALLSSSGKN